MAELDDIFEIFIERLISKEMFYTQYGTAKDVDKEKRTCTLVPSGDFAERPVRLQPLMDSKRGLVVIPVEGSQIAVTFTNKNTAILVASEDIEEVIYQGGENGGLINIEPLTSKINTLESDLNNLKTAIASWVPVPNDGGASLKALITSYAASSITLTTRNDIEDTKFQH